MRQFSPGHDKVLFTLLAKARQKWRKDKKQSGRNKRE